MKKRQISSHERAIQNEPSFATSQISNSTRDVDVVVVVVLKWEVKMLTKTNFAAGNQDQIWKRVEEPGVGRGHHLPPGIVSSTMLTCKQILRRKFKKVRPFYKYEKQINFSCKMVGL